MSVGSTTNLPQTDLSGNVKAVDAALIQSLATTNPELIALMVSAEKSNLVAQQLNSQIQVLQIRKEKLLEAYTLPAKVEVAYTEVKAELKAQADKEQAVLTQAQKDLNAEQEGLKKKVDGLQGQLSTEARKIYAERDRDLAALRETMTKSGASQSDIDKAVTKRMDTYQKKIDANYNSYSAQIKSAETTSKATSADILSKAEKQYAEWCADQGIKPGRIDPNLSPHDKLEAMKKEIDANRAEIQKGNVDSPASRRIIAANAKVQELNGKFKEIGIPVKIEKMDDFKTAAAKIYAWIAQEKAALQAETQRLLQMLSKAFEELGAEAQTAMQGVKDVTQQGERQIAAFGLLMADLKTQVEGQEAKQAQSPVGKSTSISDSPEVAMSQTDLDAFQKDIEETLRKMDDTLSDANAAVAKMENFYKENGMQPGDAKKFIENLPPSERAKVETELEEWNLQVKREIDDALQQKSNVDLPNPNSLFRGIRI